MRGHVGFDPKVRRGDGFQSFWSGPGAYGTVTIGGTGMAVAVIGGTLALASLGLPRGAGGVTAVTLNGRPVSFGAEDGTLTFPALRLHAGDRLEVKAATLLGGDIPDIGEL